MRGAGHKLGVIVEPTFKTYPDKGGMHYNADMIFTDDSIDGVLQTTKNVIKTGLDCSVFFFEAASPHVIASVPDEATAYPHRGKMLTNAIIQVTWGDEEWKWEGLTALKREYDPAVYFDGYHGIPRVLEGWYAPGEDVGVGNGRQKPLTMPHEEL
ncbi:uncharacterized protein B0T23DRAFT_452018 [Neurospora hispaniola]|uniref:Uncharacterized protein n=1 Tax=Neurospora hispaniola TaxID=588809 RepID=A0AAJ0MUA4_9PEZI|nr:hypothetical protein B0T23DRAFT_452018 [Neurospora hispaniola]